MAAGRFRQLSDRMDSLLVRRLGDRAILADGSELFGAFSSAFMGAEMSGRGHRIGAVADPDDVAQPTFTARAADVVALVKGVFLTIDLPADLGGGRHIVVRQKPDGFGMVDLVLRPSNERTENPA